MIQRPGSVGVSRSPKAKNKSEITREIRLKAFDKVSFVIRRWLQLYRNKLRICINTYNGEERQSKTLKQYHMRWRSDKFLAGLMTVLHREFLPVAWLR